MEVESRLQRSNRNTNLQMETPSSFRGQALKATSATLPECGCHGVIRAPSCLSDLEALIGVDDHLGGHLGSLASKPFSFIIQNTIFSTSSKLTTSDRRS